MEILPESVYNKIKKYGFNKKNSYVLNSNNWYWNSVDRMITTNKLHRHYVDLCEKDGGIRTKTTYVLAYHYETDKYFFRQKCGNTDRMETIIRDENYIPKDSELLSFTQAIQLICMK
jgi:hypothetical protein